MQQPTLDQSPFPNGFEPAKAAEEYLRSHQAGKLVLFLIGMLILLGLVGYPTPEEKRSGSYLDTIPFDDEPLDDEDRAALEESREGAISLDEYFERRAGRDGTAISS
jgi:hypothetical protein